MKSKGLKRLGVFVAVVALLAGGAAFGVRHLLGGPFIKEQLARVVHQATGRTLTVSGDIRPTWSLTPTVKVTGFALENAPWAGKEPMIAGETLAVQVALRPLLDRQVVIRSVTLEGAVLRLSRREDGTANWAFEPAAKPAAPAAAEPEASAPARQPAGFTLDDLTLKDVTVQYQDGKQPPRVLTVRDGRVALPDGLNGKATVEAKGALDGAGFTLKAAVDDLSVAEKGSSGVTVSLTAGDGVSLDAKGTVANTGGGWSFDQELTAALKNTDSFRKLAGSALPVQTLEVKTRLSGSPEAFTLKPLRVVADGNAVTGEAAVKSRKGGGWAITTTLAADTLTLADSGAAPAPDTGGKDGGATGAAGSGGGGGRVIPDVPLSFSLPADLDVNAKLAVGTLNAGGTVLKDLAVHAALADGALAFKPLTAQVEGGRVEASGTVRPAGKSTAVTLSLNTSGYVLGNLLKERGITTALSEGPLQLSFNASGAGATLRGLLGSLDGKAAMAMDRASYRVAYDSGAAQFLRLLSGGKEGRDLTINCAVADFTIAGGVMQTKSIAADTVGATVRGSGTVNLGTEQLNLVLTPRAKDAALASIAIPLKIGGTFANPVATPDTGMAAATAVRAAAGLAGLGAGKALGVAQSGDTTGTGVARCRQILTEPEPQAQKPADVVRESVGGAVQQLLEKKLHKKQGGDAAPAEASGGGAAPAAKPKLEDQLKKVLPF